MTIRLIAKRRVACFAALTLAFLIAAVPALAAVVGQIGPYHVTLATDPATIPIGRANVLLKIADADGAPVEGARIVTLVKMPTMDMGESEQRAVAQTEPGVYMAPATFSMEGPYVAILRITGPAGEGSGEIALHTGMNTGTLEGGDVRSPVARALPWVVAAALGLFVAYRMRKTGQRVNWRAAMHWQFIAGVAVLVGMTLLAMYAVDNWRRPGAMTPIEAQAMEMNTPAPPGVAPVTLAEVSRGPVVESVRYTGQAVGYVEEDVYPRARGWITWMPLYVGDRVKKGQVIARLDTSEIEPQIAEREAAAQAVGQGATVAGAEHRQALEVVNRMRAEIRGREAGLRDARAGLDAARAERAEAEASVAAAQSLVSEAEAELDTARATNAYWQEQVKRTRALRDAGAASGQELGRETSQAAEAAAKVRQAEARIRQARAEVQARQSAIRRADAGIRAATAKVAQMTSEVEAGRSQVRSAQASVEAARARIGVASASAAQARAATAAAATQRGYSEIRARVDGVVTQRLISPGVLVEPGQAILKIAQINPIRLQANVAEADRRRIKTGASVALRGAEGDAPVYARVTTIAPSVDPASRTGIVEAVYENPSDRFLPGEYVVMDITLGKAENALRIPIAAVRERTRASGGILSDETSYYVWIADPEEGVEGQYTVRAVPVSLGTRGSGMVEVRSGLKAGDRVVTEGYQSLSDGDAVVAGDQTKGTAP